MSRQPERPAPSASSIAGSFPLHATVLRLRVHTRLTVKIAWLLASCVLLGVFPGSASARRVARAGELRSISTAVRGYAHSSGCWATGRVRVLRPAWISTVDPAFRVTTVAIARATGGAAPRASIVLVHAYSGALVVIALGTARLACGVTPAIRHNLRLPACG